MEEKEVNDYDTDDLHHSLGEHYQAPEDSTPHWHTLVAHMEDSTREINRALISGHKIEDYFQGDGPANTAARDYHRDLHAAVDHTMVNGGAPYHFKVYSGVSDAHGEILNGLKNHDTVHFPAWTSTSLEKDVARNFSSKHVAVFNIRPGFREGAYIAHTTPAWSDEREFLLKPGTRWRKTGEHTQVVHRRGDGHAITMTHHHFEPVNETA